MSAQTSPAARQATLMRDSLEAALLEIAALPVGDAAEDLRAMFESSLEAVSALAHSAPTEMGHLELFDHAAWETARLARTVLQLDVDISGDVATRIAVAAKALQEKRDATIDVMVSVQEAARRSAGSAPPPAPELAASMGSPQLHDPLRPRLQTQVRLAEDLEADEPEDDAVAHFGPAAQDITRLQILGGVSLLADVDIAQHGEVGHTAFIQRAAHDCVEEMGAVSILHPREDDDMWDGANQARIEQRILNNLDALLSLGEPFVSTREGVDHFEHRFDVLGEVLRISRDGIAADERRAFARAFVLGCVDGDDTIRAALMALRQSHRLTWNAQAHALALASGNAVNPALTRLCRDASDPALLSFALDVLARRQRCPTAEALLLLQHAEPAVRLAAARCMSHAAEHEAVVEALRATAETEPNDHVLAAISAALFVHDEAAALALARQCLSDERNEPGTFSKAAFSRLLMVVATAGQAADIGLVQQGFTADEMHCAAIGFHGFPGHVPLLLSVLDPQSKIVATSSMRRMAARALIRITGAPLIRAAEEVNYDLYEPDKDHRSWQLWWEANAEDLEGETRLRYGAPYSPLTVLAELERPRMPFYVRRQLGAELRRALPACRFDPHTFMAAQERSLEEAHTLHAEL